MLRNLFFVAALIFSSNSVFGDAVPSTPQDYIHVFKTGTLGSQIEAAKSLRFSGLSSEEVFDVVEKNLNKYVLVPDEDSVTVYYVIWMAKALSFSGNEKYKKSIENVAANGLRSSVKRHASVALSDLDKYRDLNKVIAPLPWDNDSYPAKDVRIVNMIKSDLSELQLSAAMDVFENKNYKNDILLALRSEVEDRYRRSLNDDELDAVAWMCKALAGSGAPEQFIFLGEVEGAAKESKLKKYVKSYMAKFQ